MFKKPNCPVIAVEEHYWDKEMSATYVGLEASRPGPQSERLFDLGALRLKEMDACGIDMQVISHGAPSAQNYPTGTVGSKPGRVVSPYEPHHELDVRGLPSGSLALDPTTQKVFKVP